MVQQKETQGNKNIDKDEKNLVEQTKPACLTFTHSFQLIFRADQHKPFTVGAPIRVFGADQNSQEAVSVDADNGVYLKPSIYPVASFI